MCNIKCLIIPVIIEATGTVTEGLEKDLETILGKRAIESLQKQLRMEYWYIGDNVESKRTAV
jgi:hypothetical protein